MGVPYLIKSLNYSFVNHIKKCLPSIREKFIHLISVSLTFIELPVKWVRFPAVRGLWAVRWQQLKEHDHPELDIKVLHGVQGPATYLRNYKLRLDGNYLKESNDELMGGSRINYIFTEIFRKTILEMDPFDNFSDNDIRTAIKNSNGITPVLFVPEGAFENLTKQQIARFC